MIDLKRLDIHARIFPDLVVNKCIEPESEKSLQNALRRCDLIRRDRAKNMLFVRHFIRILVPETKTCVTGFLNDC